MANGLILNGFKRLALIGCTLPGQPGSNVWFCRNFSQAINSRVRSGTLHSTLFSRLQPAVAPILVPSATYSFCKLNMVNTVEVVSTTDTNGCDNGHKSNQEVLVDSASFKEVKIPLAWGHLAGMQIF